MWYPAKKSRIFIWSTSRRGSVFVRIGTDHYGGVGLCLFVNALKKDCRSPMLKKNGTRTWVNIGHLPNRILHAVAYCSQAWASKKQLWEWSTTTYESDSWSLGEWSGLKKLCWWETCQYHSTSQPSPQTGLTRLATFFTPASSHGTVSGKLIWTFSRNVWQLWILV